MKLPFDKVYCLHLVEAKEREKNIEEQFKKIGILEDVKIWYSCLHPLSQDIAIFLHENKKFICDNKNKGGAFNCTREHYNIIKTAYYKGYNSILVFEDDINFIINENQFNEIMKNVPADFDIIRFRNISKSNSQKFYESKEQIWGTYMYALSRKGMKYYIDYIDKKYAVADMPLYDINEIIKYGCKNYVCSEQILTLDDDINKKSFIGNNILDISNFKLKEDFKVQNPNFLICIFNYRHDDNARKWHNLLSPYFECVVLDSGNDKECKDFIQFPNIYYSGLFNEMKKLSEKNDYKWIGVIPSDITIDNENEKKLLEKIPWLLTTKNIGIWQPSLDSTSRNWLGNIHNNFLTFEGKRFIEANIFFIKNEILKDCLFIDTVENSLGYGVSEMLSLLSIKKGFNNIFDNSVQIHHPKEIGYSHQKACSESKIWAPKMAEHFGFDYELIIHPKPNSLGEVKITFIEKEDIFHKNEILKRICEPAEGEFKQFFSKEERIIVTMTSWKKRIGNVSTVLKTILENTELPDLIVINLATEEFPNKEQDLPQELNNLVKEKNGLIEINWLKNNTKVWKKVFPTLFKYPNDCTINIDDDFLYPNDFIKTFKDKHKEIPNKQLVGVAAKFWKSHNQHCGCASMDKLEWFGEPIFNLNQKCIDSIGDDDFYTYCLYVNNMESVFVGKKFFSNMKSFNSVAGFSVSAGLMSRTKINQVLNTLPFPNEAPQPIETKKEPVIDQPIIDSMIISSQSKKFTPKPQPSAAIRPSIERNPKIRSRALRILMG